jgi:hypothetical protein
MGKEMSHRNGKKFYTVGIYQVQLDEIIQLAAYAIDRAEKLGISPEVDTIAELRKHDGLPEEPKTKEPDESGSMINKAL